MKNHRLRQRSIATRRGGLSGDDGWDPVTGLGTPNAANLLPDLVQAVHGN